MKRSECMVCSGNRLVEFIDLGAQPNGNNFLYAEDVAQEVSFPLAMMVCQDCWEVQISEFPSQEVLFSDHPYLSGVNAPVVAHFEQLAALWDHPLDRAANFARYRATASWAVNIDRLLEVVAAVN